jgi:hypothetical protein
MTKDERHKAIEALENHRGSRVIAYLTADRGVASTQITEDVLRVIYDHVRAIGRVEKLDLLLYSRGGDAMLPWPLVTTLRQFCDELGVLIPFRAHSAATLISLGADEIVMTPVGQLTPIEPTVKMPFSPPDPVNPGQKLGINVEDVATYFDFVRDRAGITSDEGRISALSALTGEVHPVALGNLERSHQLARMQGEKLLELHLDPGTERERIQRIVDSLVVRLWAHEYKIGREEARELGLPVLTASSDVENAIWDLYEGYETAMKLRTPITPTNAFSSGQAAGQAMATETDVKLAYVESREQTDAFVADLQMTRPQVPTTPGQPQQFGAQVQISVTRQEWVQE